MDNFWNEIYTNKAKPWLYHGDGRGTDDVSRGAVCDDDLYAERGTNTSAIARCSCEKVDGGIMAPIEAPVCFGHVRIAGDSA